MKKYTVSFVINTRFLFFIDSFYGVYDGKNLVCRCDELQDALLIAHLLAISQNEGVRVSEHDHGACSESGVE